MAEIQNEMLQLGVYALVVRGQGQDLLMGTNVHDYIQVDGLESLLSRFISDLDQSFSYIYENDIAGYLNSLEEKFKLDLSSLQENIEVNIQAMEETKSDDIMIYYLVITKTLEFLRQEIFNTKGWERIKKIYQRNLGKVPAKRILNEINNIDNRVNKNISLLYNLIFTEFLAELYNEQRFLEICQKKVEDSVLGLLETLK